MLLFDYLYNKNIMSQTKTYDLIVPYSLDGVQLHQYQKYLKVLNENKDNVDEEFLRLKILEIFCGLTLKEAYELAAVDVDEILNLIIGVLNEQSPLQRRFTMTDSNGTTVEFGFITNLERISLGEFVDAESYLSDWDNMHKALAVLYRPITGSKGEFYEIEKYQGSDKYSEIMKDAPASVAIGATLFFYNLGMTLLGVTMDSLMNQSRVNTEDQQQTQSPSDKNGDGISRSMHLLKETHLKLQKLQKDLSTHASYGLSSKKIKTN
jgi:hypothetical protein